MGSDEFNEKGLIAQPTNTERIASIFAVISSAVPWVGGLLSNLSSGFVTNRRFQRIEGTLQYLADLLQDQEPTDPEQPVDVEEFEDLILEVVERTAKERDEKKRALYAQFLANSILHPSNSDYDERIRLLRIMEQVNWRHYQALRAIAQEPGTPKNSTLSSPIQVLEGRISEMTSNDIEEAVAELNALMLTDLQRVHTMMTPAGAENLQGAVRPLGVRFLEHLAGFDQKCEWRG